MRAPALEIVRECSPGEVEARAHSKDAVGDQSLVSLLWGLAATPVAA